MPKIYTEPFWHLGSYRYPYYRYKLRTLFELYVKKSHLVLDAGCGDGGGYLVTMSQNTCGVGFDIDRKSIEKSMKKARDIQFHNLSVFWEKVVLVDKETHFQNIYLML